MKRIGGWILAGIAVVAFGGSAVAKPHGRGGDDDRGPPGLEDKGGVPPGLAKKHNGCMPPGQARKLARGQRWQSLYGSRYGYGQIPYDLRRQYDLNPRYNYYYGNGYLYQVDPRTLLVQQVISALLR